MYNALIRTHHITSRKKVAALKSAAKKYQCYVLLRFGGIPGVMYVQGDHSSDVQNWVDTVHDLRYKDYQLVAPVNQTSQFLASTDSGILEEVGTVKEIGSRMDASGLTQWWRIAMGFEH